MKQRKLVITKEAREEIQSSYEFYENQTPGLGERFVEKVDKTFDLICINPEMFNVVPEFYREARVRKFPFLVLFEHEEDVITIYSVFHTSRNPKKKFKK